MMAISSIKDDLYREQNNLSTTHSNNHSISNNKKHELVTTDKSDNIHNSLVSSVSYLNDIYTYAPNPATDCMLKLEKNYAPLMYGWNLADKPILHSIKIINDTFYVMLNMFDLQKHIQKKWLDATYSCNGVPGGKVEKMFTQGRGNLIVECPISINASKNVLTSFSVVPIMVSSSEKDANVSASEPFTYETELFDECERKDIEHFSTFLSKDVKTGVTATIKGNRTKALEWAAYHHLIGFDHIWIYLNEDWDNATNIVHRDYITWIPYKFNIMNTLNYNKPRAFNPMNIFRIASQNDALWRAKRMGMEWIVPSDFDEYVVFNPPKSKIDDNSSQIIPSFDQREHDQGAVSVSDIDTLPKFLKTFQRGVGGRFVGIQMNSIPFGSNKNVEDVKNTPIDLSMDYVWRQRGIVESNFRSRYKLILNVTEATSVNIHYLGGSSSGNRKLWEPPSSELRINHYKKPESGVFNHKHGVLDPTKLELDSSLSEKYRTKLLHELHSSATKKI